MSQSIIARIAATTDSLSPLALRIPLGIVFAAHGSQKLFGWFGGYGLEGTGKFMASLGMNPGELMAALAGGAEFFGGLALVIGLMARPAALSLAFAMIVAIATVHLKNGLFLANNGYEFGLALLAGTASLLISGAGAYSVDSALSKAPSDSAPELARASDAPKPEAGRA
jgi:putative oxidoreductase